ncbi:MAG TPA: hypothetical protein VFS54_12790 [Solirubrobacterales bacterium]|nr:hypothetical protein [Solirubrobacterales bacterium]
MRYYRGSSPSLLRLLVAGALLCLCLVAFGCGSSDSNSEENRQEREAAQTTKEERESREVERELESSAFVHCGRKVYASEKSLCTFALNVEQAYYTEVVAGEGKAVGYHPPAKQDYRVLCSGTVPHRCTTFKNDENGIESLPSGVIFFSP